MPSIQYNRDIPDGPNNPSNDQPKMKINTNSIDDLIAVDHFSFEVGTNNSGTHKQVTLTNQAAPGFAGGNGALYADLFNGNSWPIWQNALGNTILVAGPTSALANGFVSLPGALIMKWGIVNGTHGADNHFNDGDSNTEPLNFPNNTFIVLTNGNYNSNTGSAPSSQATFAIDTFLTTKTQFKWTLKTNSSQYTSFFWIAIGN